MIGLKLSLDSIDSKADDIPSYFHSINEYLLKTFIVPGTVLYVEDSVLGGGEEGKKKKKGKIHAFGELPFSMEAINCYKKSKIQIAKI